MNILHVNNFHYFRGGSEVVYFKTADVLKKHGHSSLYFSMDHPRNLYCATENYFVSHIDLSSNSSGIMSKAKMAGRILYSFEAKKSLAHLLNKYPIDVAHMHNVYHELSPSIIDVFKKKKIPMVMTLHDFKMVCASYSLFTDGKPCEACHGGKYFESLKNRCVKGSHSKSLLAALEMYLHHKVLDIYDNVDIYISPSLFLKNKLREMGFKKEIIHLPNFIDIKRFEEMDDESDGKENTMVYFGRLSQGKGLKTLLDAANMLDNKIRVNIIGDGPIKQQLQNKVKTDKISNVYFLGYMKGEHLLREINKSMAVILPSEGYENNPMSVLEAFALGKPVIGSRIGGIPELVRDNETGLTFEPGNAEDLREKIVWLLSHKSARNEMGKKAHQFVISELNPEKYYQRLMNIYRMAINAK